jgi:hypothetical protein
MASLKSNPNRWYVVTADAIFLGGKIYLHGDQVEADNVPQRLTELLKDFLFELAEPLRAAA